MQFFKEYLCTISYQSLILLRLLFILALWEIKKFVKVNMMLLPHVYVYVKQGIYYMLQLAK